MPLLLIVVLAVLTAQQPATSPPPTSSSLDYAFFRDRVQPIFLAKRPGHARCITCHANGTPRLAALLPGAAAWNEEQSRANYAAWQAVVVPGDPAASRLLMHPLAKAAGGDPFHAGGKHWQSQSDPEFQTLAAWVQTGSRQPAAATAAAGAGLDFEYYRTRIEPIFLKARAPGEGNGACVSCHARIATRMRLQPLPPGATAWTAEQSRQNFDAVSRVVTAADAMTSPLLVHPLAQAAGGDAQHTGGKFWTSQ
jgi:cytochrome c553